MCENFCCCVDDAKKEPRISPELLKGDGDVSCAYAEDGRKLLAKLITSSMMFNFEAFGVQYFCSKFVSNFMNF